MNDKPKMYQNKVNKEFHNNKMVYTTYNQDNSKYNQIKDTNLIRKKINNIINSDSFIYRKLVYIIIGNEVVKKKIIGLDNNNLITIDNEYIPLDSIEDIYI